MAKTNITTAAAIQQIKLLAAEITTLKGTVSSMSVSSIASFAKVEASIKGLTRTTVELNNKIIKLEVTIKKQKAALDKTATATSKVTKEQVKAVRSSGRLKGAFTQLNKSTLALFKAFGLIKGAELFVRQILQGVKLIITLDSLRFAMEKITKTQWAMGQSQLFIMELNQQFGVEIVSTTERWIKFLAAADQSNLSLQDSEKIFKSMTKAGAVLGLQTDELRGIYLALEQMLSKGKVTTEELRRQLGERLPGAMGIMAASMGIGIEELDKMMKKGEVLSAEVLPGFADAVEIAFGIDTLDKVDNLQASVGRLDGAWQTFMANIAESEGPAVKALGGFLDFLNDFVGKATYLLADDEQKFRLDKMMFRPGWEEEYNQMAQNAVEKIDGFGDVVKNKKQEIEDNLVEIARTANEDEIKDLRAKNDILANEIAIYGKRVGEEKRKLAAEKFKDLQVELEKEKKELQKSIDERKKIAEEEQHWMVQQAREVGKALGVMVALNPDAFVGPVNEDELKVLDKKIAKNRQSLLITETEYDLVRKILGLSDTPGGATEEDGAKPKRQRLLKAKPDLENDIRIKTLENSIAASEQLIELDQTTYDERLAIASDFAIKKGKIAGLEYDKQIERINVAAQNERDSWEKSYKDGTATAAKRDEAIAAIDEELRQKTILAEQDLANKMARVQTDFEVKLRSFRDEKLNLVLDEIQQEEDLRRAFAIRKFNDSKKSAKDQEQLDLELSRIAIDGVNKRIDKQIEYLQSLIDTEKVSEETKKQWEQLIAELEGTRPIEPVVDVEDWKKQFDLLIQLAKDFTSAIGDIVDNLHQGRIDNIEGEIRAEREKYDAMILLAQGNDTKVKVLERNKELREKQLEKRKLREKQKQAKAAKIFAIADIAINTAVAIARQYADNNYIVATIFAALIGTVAAFQIAAVNAQPIPKYKEGGKIDTDHVGMINDGSSKEYLERDGQILSTDRKNAIVALKRDDIIHKDYDSLKRKSLLVSSVSNGAELSQNEFDKLFEVVEESIKSGFKKAKVNNHIHIPKSDNGYGNEMSYWS